jgi:hypothetical protein
MDQQQVVLSAEQESSRYNIGLCLLYRIVKGWSARSGRRAVGV